MTNSEITSKAFRNVAFREGVNSSYLASVSCAYSGDKRDDFYRGRIAGQQREGFSAPTVGQLGKAMFDRFKEDGTI